MMAFCVEFIVIFKDFKSSLSKITCSLVWFC